MQPGRINTHTFKLCDYNVDWLVVMLEGAMFTGCVKIRSLNDNARSAIILKRGRIITAVYESHVDCSETSLVRIWQNLEAPGTVVEIIDLPELNTDELLAKL
ncbi:MAG: hypothetical protein EKK48_10505 [Candidatus Melainabacteria bacterium]|nr:MAG: hypothetical protein EKK48_10505 [Candidatus Melainabacteria bacterium]